MPRKLLALVLFGLLFSSPAYAQQTKANMNAEVNTNFPDNTSGLITPAITRATHADEINSYQQAPQVRSVTSGPDTLTAADFGNLVKYNSASAVAVSLAQATGSYNVLVTNVNTGIVTITPTTSTIGGAAFLTLPQGQSRWIVSDGFNYQIFNGDKGKWPSIEDFGAVCDGITNDATAVSNATAAFSSVYVGPGAPAGTKCKVATASTSLTGKLFGQNAQLLDGSGNQRGYFFSAVSANQAYTATNENSIETAFNGNFTGGQINIEHRITGTATLTQPTSGYIYSPWAYPIYGQMLNTSGWNNGTANSAGRTAAVFSRLYVQHQGQGDGVVYNATCALGSQSRSGATSWLAEPSCALYNGQAGANAANQNLTPTQFEMDDNGNGSVSGIGQVVLSNRTNTDVNGLGSYWAAYISESIGSKPIEEALTGFGPHIAGVDFTPTTFQTNKSAIIIKSQDKIYLNGSSSNGNFATSLGSPAAYLDYNSTSGAIEAENAPFRVQVGTASTLPLCASASEGSMQAVTDANANTWGTTIVGAGANHVLAYCDGTNWTIMAK